MTLDIRGGRKNISISSNQYVVFEELTSNAIDSYLIRKSNDKNSPPLSIQIHVELFEYSLIDPLAFDISISCKDNGAGFADAQVKAFATRDTTFKDDLSIPGIGRCKGAGRIQFFHQFNQLKIHSTYADGIDFFTRSLDIYENTKEISEDSFIKEASKEHTLETEIILQKIRKNSPYSKLESKELEHTLSASNIGRHLKVCFLQRFILLGGIIGNFSLEISDSNGGRFSVTPDLLPKNIDTKEIAIRCRHQNITTIEPQILKVTRYNTPYSVLQENQHEIALCANSAIVKSIIKKFIKVSSDLTTPIEGNYELLLIESVYLEDTVNEQRDNFFIPNDCSSNNSSEKYSLQDIIDSIEDYVFEILTPKDFDKEALIKSTENKFGISSSMISSTNIKVRYTDTEDSIAKRVLRKLQEDIIDETSKIFDLKQEILSLNPNSNDFRENINSLSWKYTATIKKMDMANLSQLIVRRASILEVLKYATDLLLPCQNSERKAKISQDEKIIHNIFFPTGKDSNDAVDHDIWILNEEYHYFKHIASDKALASIPWTGSEKLFEDDIDIELQQLFQKNNSDHKLKRPDIAIFNEEGSAIIIELKAPGVEIQEHINDLYQYSRLLAAKSNGKIRKFYGYLIGDTIDESRVPPPPTLEKFPSKLGYFGTSIIRDPNTGLQYGELYTEVLLYNQFIERAERRLEIYKKKLNLEF